MASSASGICPALRSRRSTPRSRAAARLAMAEAARARRAPPLFARHLSRSPFAPLLPCGDLVTPLGVPPAASPLPQVTYLAWNCKVQHIVASTSVKGTTIVWDLKRQKPVISFTDPNRHDGSPADRPESARSPRRPPRRPAMTRRSPPPQQPAVLGSSVEPGGCHAAHRRVGR